VVLFVKLRGPHKLEDHLEDRIRFEIRRHASPRHVPARIVQVSDIPRTKNGKVVELAVKAVVHGMPVANTDALANPEALELFRNLPELQT
jgi:acetoacetyl-CoA synthetase